MGIQQTHWPTLIICFAFCQWTAPEWIDARPTYNASWDRSCYFFNPFLLCVIYLVDKISAVSNWGWCFCRHLWKTPSWKMHALAQQKGCQSDWKRMNYYSPVYVLNSLNLMFDMFVGPDFSGHLFTCPWYMGEKKTFYSSQSLSQDPSKVWFRDVRNPWTSDSRRNYTNLRRTLGTTFFCFFRIFWILSGKHHGLLTTFSCNSRLSPVGPNHFN